jgi:twitching motility protein PilT
VKECIMDPNKTVDIPELMESGNVQYGMQTFDQSIMGLYKRGMISFEEAMANATNPDDLDLRLKGITGAADRWQEDGKDASAEQAPHGLKKNKDFSGFQKY